MWRCLLLLSVSFALAASPARAQTECWPHRDADAEQVRALQTMLMVAALQCRGRPELGLLDAYNRFVRARGAEIATQNDVLKARFVRLHGPRDGQTAYDRFITRVANDFGRTAQGADFCQTASTAANRVVESANLVAEARAIVGARPALPSCSGF
jgi:hypothetical protein